MQPIFDDARAAINAAAVEIRRVPRPRLVAAEQGRSEHDPWCLVGPAGAADPDGWQAGIGGFE